MTSPLLCRLLEAPYTFKATIPAGYNVELGDAKPCGHVAAVRFSSDRLDWANGRIGGHVRPYIRLSPFSFFFLVELLGRAADSRGGTGEVGGSSAMSILTDYFIADAQQPAIVFAAWLTVVNEPVMREVKNPFTGQTQRVKDWPPGKPVSNAEPAHSPDLSNVPHVHLKSVDPVKLATLNYILTGTPVRDALDAFLKPALVHRKNE